MEGYVKWYSEKKGYGFITSAEDEELFFHKSGIKEYGFFGLQTDDRVIFDVKETGRGKQAVNIKAYKSYLSGNQ